MALQRRLSQWACATPRQRHMEASCNSSACVCRGQDGARGQARALPSSGSSSPGILSFNSYSRDTAIVPILQMTVSGTGPTQTSYLGKVGLEQPHVPPGLPSPSWPSWTRPGVPGIPPWATNSQAVPKWPGQKGLAAVTQ